MNNARHAQILAIARSPWRWVFRGRALLEELIAEIARLQGQYDRAAQTLMQERAEREDYISDMVDLALHGKGRTADSLRAASDARMAVRQGRAVAAGLLKSRVGKRLLGWFR
jgi:hypothetical protein